MLVVPAGERVSALERLRREPTRATAPALVEALRRLAEVRALGVSDLDLSNVPAGHIRTLARYAATAWASVIARMPPARRTATLVSFARVFEATAQDDALDVLDLMIGTLLARVENEGDQARLRTIRDLDAAALPLLRSRRQTGERGLREVGAGGGINARDGAFVIRAQPCAGEQIGSSGVAGDGPDPMRVAPHPWREGHGQIMLTRS